MNRAERLKGKSVWHPGTIRLDAYQATASPGSNALVPPLQFDKCQVSKLDHSYAGRTISM